MKPASNALLAKTPSRRRNRTPDINKAIMAFKEKEGERAKHLDPLKMLEHLQRKARKAIQISEHLFDFGFSLDGKFYYITSRAILGRHWTDDFDSIIDRAKIIPRIYIIMSNLKAEVVSVFEDVKTDYEVWIGKQWMKADDPAGGLYGGTVKKIQSFIAKQPDAVDFRRDLSELRSIIGKVNGVLKAIDMQHAAVVAMIYHTRKSGDIFASGAGSIINSLDTTPEITEDPITSFDMDKEEADEIRPYVKKDKHKGKKHHVKSSKEE